MQILWLVVKESGDHFSTSDLAEVVDDLGQVVQQDEVVSDEHICKCGGNWRQELFQMRIEKLWIFLEDI
jgi:hypothetical protein